MNAECEAIVDPRIPPMPGTEKVGISSRGHDIARSKREVP